MFIRGGNLACYLIAENGDQDLFGGFTTKQMKERLGV